MVVIDQPLMFNRLGAANVNGMIYSLRRDVIDNNGIPLTDAGHAAASSRQAAPSPGPSRPRGGLPHGQPRKPPDAGGEPFNTFPAEVPPFNIHIDDQPRDRFVGFHAAGTQMVTGVYDDGSIVGSNTVLENPANHEGGLISPGNSTTYRLFAEKEGVFVISSEAVLVGSEANAGHIANGLFGQLIVQPKGSRIYRSQVHEEELRLAADRDRNGAVDNTDDIAERTPDWNLVRIRISGMTMGHPSACSEKSCLDGTG